MQKIIVLALIGASFLGGTQYQNWKLSPTVQTIQPPTYRSLNISESTALTNMLLSENLSDPYPNNSVGEVVAIQTTPSKNKELLDKTSSTVESAKIMDETIVVFDIGNGSRYVDLWTLNFYSPDKFTNNQ